MRLTIWTLALVLAGWTASPAYADEAPRIVVTSRVPSGAGVHVVGFLEGVDLKTAAIFDRSEKMKDIQVSDVHGSQRVNFDLNIAAASPDMRIEVTDAMGRSASAIIGPQVATAPSSPPPAPAVPSEGAESAPALPPPQSPGNTAEVPRYGGSGALDSGSHRRLTGGVAHALTGVRIEVMSVQPSMSQPGSYEVVGQIQGAGVHRAGIYVDGRPIKPIPVTPGSYSSFDVIFPMTGGGTPAIRAYGAGNNYVESEIGLGEGVTTYSNSYGNQYPRPYGYPYGPYVNPYASPYNNPYAAPYPPSRNPYNPYNPYGRSPGRTWP